MGLFTRDAEPEDSARWSVSLHEAAHVVAAETIGGQAWAWLNSDGRTGGFEADIPGDAEPVDVAAVHLAGGVAQQMLLGRDGPSDEDERNARAELRGTGISMGQARRRARQVVAAQRGQIKRRARRLHDSGRI